MKYRHHLQNNKYIRRNLPTRIKRQIEFNFMNATMPVDDINYTEAT